MTVAELIALLQTMPQELPVTVGVYSERLDEVVYDELRDHAVWAPQATERFRRSSKAAPTLVEWKTGPHVRIG